MFNSKKYKYILIVSIILLIANLLSVLLLGRDILTEGIIETAYIGLFIVYLILSIRSGNPYSKTILPIVFVIMALFNLSIFKEVLDSIQSIFREIPHGGGTWEDYVEYGIYPTLLYLVSAIAELLLALNCTLEFKYYKVSIVLSVIATIMPIVVMVRNINMIYTPVYMYFLHAMFNVLWHIFVIIFFAVIVRTEVIAKEEWIEKI